MRLGHGVCTQASSWSPLVPRGLTCSPGLGCFPRQRSILFPRLEGPAGSAGSSLHLSATPAPLRCGLAQPTSGPQCWGRSCLVPRGRTLRCSGFSKGHPKEKVRGSSEHPTGKGGRSRDEPLSPPPGGRLSPWPLWGHPSSLSGQPCLLNVPRPLGMPHNCPPLPPSGLLPQDCTPQRAVSVALDLQLCFPGNPSQATTMSWALSMARCCVWLSFCRRHGSASFVKGDELGPNMSDVASSDVHPEFALSASCWVAQVGVGPGGHHAVLTSSP